MPTLIRRLSIVARYPTHLSFIDVDARFPPDASAVNMMIFASGAGLTTRRRPDAAPRPPS
jgi:hypothetical protein